MSIVGRALVPPTQRLSREELRDALDLGYGDVQGKQSGFIIMLTLSAIIAVAGVMSDSTATVIGAMIIAPLSTPILGIALGLVTGQRGLVPRSCLWVLGGLLMVFLVGVLMSAVITDPTNLRTNSQVTGRTSPQLLDLLAAFATGTAGVLAICRRDLGSVLPGVAISISLVPPLGVAGVCAGQQAWDAVLGSTLLFLSNVVALVIAGSFVFTLTGYSKDPESTTAANRTRAYRIVAILSLLVALPLTLNTAVTVMLTRWSSMLDTTTSAWLENAPAGNARLMPAGAVEDVQWNGATAIIKVTTRDGTVPDVTPLAQALQPELPKFIKVIIDAGVSVKYPVVHENANTP